MVKDKNETNASLLYGDLLRSNKENLPSPRDLMLRKRKPASSLGTQRGVEAMMPSGYASRKGYSSSENPAPSKNGEKNDEAVLFTPDGKRTTTKGGKSKSLARLTPDGKRVASAGNKNTAPQNYRDRYLAKQKELEEKKRKREAEEKKLQEQIAERRKKEEEQNLNNQGRELFNMLQFWINQQYCESAYTPDVIQAQIAYHQQQLGAIDPKFWF